MKTAKIKAFLDRRAPADLSALYRRGMEVQVNVRPGDGEVVTGQKVLPDGTLGAVWQGWHDPKRPGIVWKHVRIPWGDGSYVDTDLRFDLDEHALCVGLSGWDWEARRSLWVGFDFDSLVGHQTGLTDGELAQVAAACSAVPWVTVRRSKSGRGLHLYVFLDVPTASRAEHAALARAVLGLLAATTGLDVQAKVDVFGGMLWIWHRETRGSGLSLLSQGRQLRDDELPGNWRDHVAVIEGRTQKVPLRFAGQDPNAVGSAALDEHGQPLVDDSLEELVGRTRRVPLDDDHRRLLKFLAAEKAVWWWDADRHLLVAHTAQLAKAHRELGFRGLFYTRSAVWPGQNCFAFPLRKGAWVVRRHGRGTAEHPSWQRDPQGWTRTLLNHAVDLSTAAVAHEALETPKGEQVFESVLRALAALKDLGADITLLKLPDNLHHRAASLLPAKDRERVVLSIRREVSDHQLPGWLTNRKGDRWERLVRIISEDHDPEPPDELVRAIVAQGRDAGFVIRGRACWVEQTASNVRSVLLATGTPRTDLDRVLGQAVLHYWEITNLPFAEEFPGNRRWNRSAAKLAYVPSEGPCPTWDLLLDHLGRELDVTVANHAWCRKAGLLTGGDYLRAWVASVLREPLEPLPYLFFWSVENNTGKSSFHEALKLLFKDGKGVARAETALTNEQRFNAELAGAVICVTEEINLREHRVAADRVKDWVTSKTIQLHPKGGTPYDVPNSTHWIQDANALGAGPILVGDTRITVVHVGMIESEIEKRTLMSLLQAEAPGFLHRVTKLELPPPLDRLRIPVLLTEDKREALETARSLVDVFVQERCEIVPGAHLTAAAFYDAFRLSLPAEQHRFWPLSRVGRELPIGVVKGRYGQGGSLCYGNVALRSGPLPPPSPAFTVFEGKLRRTT